jgi:hypothetical protein
VRHECGEESYVTYNASSLANFSRSGASMPTSTAPTSVSSNEPALHAYTTYCMCSVKGHWEVIDVAR